MDRKFFVSACVATVAAIATAVMFIRSSNMDVIDTTWKFDKAMMRLQDGTSITVGVVKWRDYSDGDQIQIVADDGRTYLVHSVNVTLIKEAK